MPFFKRIEAVAMSRSKEHLVNVVLVHLSRLQNSKVLLCLFVFVCMLHDVLFFSGPHDCLQLVFDAFLHFVNFFLFVLVSIGNIEHRANEPEISFHMAQSWIDCIETWLIAY